MLVVALNVGPLICSLQPSLNDDVSELSAVKKILITYVAVLIYVKTKVLYLSFNKSIEMLKLHWKYEINVCWFNKHTDIYTNISFLFRIFL